MNLFDLPQAAHFCRSVQGHGQATRQQSLQVFHSSLSSRVLREGSTDFEVHRTNLLSSSERWILYAVSNYRRAIEMLVPSSAPWAHVTLYYSSFFAANAVLGMFGGWIGVTSGGGRVVDVEDGAPGSQQLRIHRRLKSPSNAVGSHRQFWDFFYDSVASLVAWTPDHLDQALSPSTGDYSWQIVPRNEVNYDMFRAWSSSVELERSFDRKKLRTLRGRIALQLEATERMVTLALHFADELSVSGWGLQGLEGDSDGQSAGRRLARQAPAKLLGQSAFADMVRGLK